MQERWRGDPRFQPLPQFGCFLAATQHGENAFIAPALGFHEAGAVVARLQMLLDVETGLGVQLGVEVGANQFVDFLALHGVVLGWERRRALRIFLRARERWPITLPSGMPSDSAISA